MSSRVDTRPHLVIVGASHAGLAVAAAVRKLNTQVTISVFSAESHLPYHRPPLSKQAVFQNPVPVQLLQPENYYAQADIQLHLNTRVTKLDSSHRQLQLHDKRHIKYDLLVLATGSSTRVLTVTGGHLAHSLYSYDDALTLNACLQDAKRVVVVGGGFIGCEFAAGANQQNKHTSLLVRSTGLMGKSISTALAQRVAAHHQQQGIKLMTQVHVHAIDAQGVHIRSHNAPASPTRLIPADLVVAGIGATPNISLAYAAGLKVDKGILVNAQGLTSDDNIYAVGDVSQFPILGYDQPRCLTSIQNSHDQGTLIGHNIAARWQGNSLETYTTHDQHTPDRSLANYQPTPWFWSDQGSLKLQMVGVINPHASINEQVITFDTGGVSVLKYTDNVLQACDTLNATSQHLSARKLLAMSTPITKNMVDKHQGDLKQLYITMK